MKGRRLGPNNINLQGFFIDEPQESEKYCKKLVLASVVLRNSPSSHPDTVTHDHSKTKSQVRVSGKREQDPRPEPQLYQPSKTQNNQLIHSQHPLLPSR